MGNHELTGEPYLAVTLYSNRLQPRGKLWDWIFQKHVIDERGREHWLSRKWSNWPFWQLYRLQGKLRPYLCRIGVHAPGDITEIDGSVWRAGCTTCHKLIPARKPAPADPEKVVEYEKFDAIAEKYDADLEAYWAGKGPCPHCSYPDGQHEYTCWEAE